MKFLNFLKKHPKESLQNSDFAKNLSSWKNKFFSQSLYSGKTPSKENSFFFQESKIFVQKAISQTFLKKSIFLLFILSVVAWQMSLTPSHEGDWREQNEYMPVFALDTTGGTLMVQHFRDFYRDSDGKDRNFWKTGLFDLNELEGMDFVISHFHDLHGIAHSFVTFRFKNGENLVISLETRLEKDQSYAPFAGIFNQFEMQYVVGSERDLIASRVGYRDEEVYLYETTADKEMTRKILEYFITDVNDLAAHPRFYNTIWRNCTTEVVTQVEQALDQKIWWSWEHLLPGYADEKALEMGFLANPKNLPFDEFQRMHKISGKNIPAEDPEFSEKIRR